MTKKGKFPPLPSMTWGEEIEALLKARAGTSYQGSAAWEYIDAIEAHLAAAKGLVWTHDHERAIPHIHNIAVLCLAMLSQAREEEEGR